MLKLFAVAFSVALTASPSFASCIGSGALRTCYDESGNSYTVNRLGNQTFMNGSNANTGSTWSQSSNTIGNSTFTNGVTNGNAWNETETTSGGMTTYSGTNANGDSFYTVCTKLGCY